MNRCETAGYITRRADTLGTTVTIVAYHVYNDGYEEGGQGLDPQCAPSAPPVDPARTQGADTDKHNSTRTQEHKKKTPLPPLPEILDTEEFRAVLTDWLAYHKPYKPQGLTAMVTRAAWRAAAHGLDAVVSAFVQAMGNGWTGWDQDSSFEKRGVGGSAKEDPMDVARRVWAEEEDQKNGDDAQTGDGGLLGFTREDIRSRHR